MKPLRARKQFTARNSIFAFIVGVILLVCLGLLLWFWQPTPDRQPYKYVSTIAGTNREFGEPFGIAVKDNEIYVSDGQSGKIWRITSGNPTIFASGLATPSGLAFDKSGNLIVADSGSHTIKSVNSKGEISTIAGVDGRSSFADGDAGVALFNAPIGVAVASDGKIYVADTYNDRIRVIENGKVSTLAGGNRGFANGSRADAKFDTPTGLTIWNDKLLVADTGNNRIRVIEPNGDVATLAGSGESDLKDGLLLSASFVQPTAITADMYGSVFVADGNSIRLIAGEVFPFVSTISSSRRGISDGQIKNSRFNRPSGLAVDDSGNLLTADSENRVVRRLSPDDNGPNITPEQVAAFRDKPEEFRQLQPPRWPYDPPGARREIAGTLGELRGEIRSGNDNIHFHNGLDIAGAYGETARFVRDEKVLRPVAVENFDSLRELLRLPTMGYIHIRLGRHSSGVPFNDPRFVFSKDSLGKMVGVRVPRGAAFKAGEPIGTLNAMNHVHLIAGRSGSEMNALDALAFPGISDSRAPTIEKVTVTDENWHEIETKSASGRIQLEGKLRIIMRAYDQVDGNAGRRRLGIYQAGYQILRADGSPVGDTQWRIRFDRLPAAAAISFVYAEGSKSGATGETIFNYIVTNRVDGDDYRQGFLDTSVLDGGQYILRVSAADYFGNTSHSDTPFEVNK